MSKIKNYKDLLQEEQRLLSQLKTKEVEIRNNLAGVKRGLKPIGRVMNIISKFTTRDKTGAFSNFGLDFGIDLIVRRFILAKAGWFTKILVPYLLKNYSSHIISEQQKARIMEKVNNFFAKLRPKTEAAPKG